MSKISVIIPCYNAEKYIKKCFEGLEKQTFREFDVIVVDDFSTDNSLNILYEIKQNSKLKIKVIKMKQNVGPGEARNVGIKASDSEYLAFCDSDDYYEENFLYCLYNKAVEQNADVVMCNSKLRLQNGSFRNNSYTNIFKIYNTKSDYIALSRTSLCYLLLRRNLFEDLPIPSLRNGEDMAIIPLLLAKAKIITHATDVDFSTIFYCSLFVSIIIYVILFFSAPYIAAFFGMPALSGILRVFSLRIPMLFIDVFIIENMPVSRLKRKILGKIYDFSYKGASVCVDYLYPSPPILQKSKENIELRKYYKLRRRIGFLFCHLGGLKFYLKLVDKIANKSKETGFYNLLEYTKAHGGKRFLFVSSGEVYGNGDLSLDEFKEEYLGAIDITSPRSCYPQSKRAVENLCASYSSQYELETVVVRPCHTYGPGITETDSRANAQFIRNALNNEDIIMKSAGNQLRSYNYIADCASGLITVLINGKSGAPYNIANPNVRITIAKLAEIIAKAVNKKVIFADPSVLDIANRTPIAKQVLSSKKLENLGWVPMFNANEGVEHTIKILKECE